MRAGVRVPMSTRVFACEWRGGGRVRKLQQTTALAERSQRAPQPPPAGAERWPFMILVTLFQEWEREGVASWSEPRPRPL